MEYKITYKVSNAKHNVLVGYKPLTYDYYIYKTVNKSDIKYIDNEGYYITNTFQITNDQQRYYNNLSLLDDTKGLPVDTYVCVLYNDEDPYTDEQKRTFDDAIKNNELCSFETLIARKLDNRDMRLYQNYLYFGNLKRIIVSSDNTNDSFVIYPNPIRKESITFSKVYPPSTTAPETITALEIKNQGNIKFTKISNGYFISDVLEFDSNIQNACGVYSHISTLKDYNDITEIVGFTFAFNSSNLADDYNDVESTIEIFSEHSVSFEVDSSTADLFYFSTKQAFSSNKANLVYSKQAALPNTKECKAPEKFKVTINEPYPINIKHYALIREYDKTKIIEVKNNDIICTMNDYTSGPLRHICIDPCVTLAKISS